MKITVHSFSNGAAIIEMPEDTPKGYVEKLKEAWDETSQRFGMPFIFAGDVDVEVIEHRNPLNGPADYILYAERASGQKVAVDPAVRGEVIGRYNVGVMKYQIERALNELGIPGDETPAPVDNAVKILRAAIGQTCGCFHPPHIGLVCGYPTKPGEFYHEGGHCGCEG
jgi:hypothetical protein